jgi:thiol-disulfide isomerase/thioredoxin
MSLAIGSPCPDFRDLPGVDGKKHALGDFSDAKVLVVVVSCNHCPHVVANEERLVKISNAYAPKGVRFIAINANDTSRYPADDLEHMIVRAKERDFRFAYVRDDSQETVRALGARFTPELFVFDEKRALRYHGRIDDNSHNPSAATSHDLVNALDALLAGQTPPVLETQATGCSVKWK